MDIAHLLAHLVPDVGHLGGSSGFAQVDPNLRDAGFDVAGGEIHLGHFLELFLQPVGHLFGHLLGRGPRPAHLHDHGLDGEIWVFFLA